MRRRRNDRQIEVLGIEAPVVGLEDLGAERGALVGEAGLAEPDRRVAARGIEVREDGPLFQFLGGGVGRQAVQLAAHGAGDRIGVCGRRHRRGDRRVGCAGGLHGARHRRGVERGGRQRQGGGKH